MKMKHYNITLFLTFLILSTYNSKNTHVQLISPENEYAQVLFQSENKGFNLINLNNGTMILTNHPDSMKIMAMNSFNSIDFNYPLTVETNTMDLVMKYSDSRLTYEDVDQWTMVALDDFQGAAEGWSKNKLSTCGTNNNMFLGGHCNFGGEDASKNFTSLPAHNMIRITANFHFFDQWNGEEAYMSFDGNPVWSDTYKWCDKVFLWYCKKYAINACGAEFPDRIAVPIDFTSI